MRMLTRLMGILGIGMAMASHADVPTDPSQVRPLPVGALAPRFHGTEVDGNVRNFGPGAYQKPTILIFYRGGWCPY